LVPKLDVSKLAAWLPAFLGVAYAAVGAIVGRVRFSYELDPDEGFNLIKVLLVDRGYVLYEDIWSDQPPGFTYLGVVFGRVLGMSVENVRLITTLAAAALVFGVADLLRRARPGVGGLVAAVACAILLPVTASFSRYSLAAMIGLPSIALALLSFWALAVADSRRLPWLAASGFLFGLSLSFKLFTAFLLPIFAAFAVARALAPAADRGRTLVRGVAAWAAGCALCLALAFGPALASGGLTQLYASHVAGGPIGSSFGALFRHLQPDLAVYGLGAAGFAFAIVTRNAVGITLGAWYAAAFAVVGTHEPLWHHHCLLISVPACALAALLFGGAAELVKARLRGALRAGASAAVAAALVAFGLPLVQTKVSTRSYDRNERQLQMDEAIRRHAPRARTMVTSKQVRAFRLGMEVPPELAVTSSKRFRSGQLSAKKVGAIVSGRHPDIVIIDRRWPAPVRESLERAMGDDYELVHSNPDSGKSQVYVLRALRRRD
jgi:hypothetical protein